MKRDTQMVTSKAVLLGCQLPKHTFTNETNLELVLLFNNISPNNQVTLEGSFLLSKLPLELGGELLELDLPLLLHPVVDLGVLSLALLHELPIQPVLLFPLQLLQPDLFIAVLKFDKDLQ